MSQYGPPPGENRPDQPGYGQQGSYNQPGPNQPGHHGGAKPGKGLAIAALVLGVLALLSSFTVIGGILFGLIALVLGFIASSKAKKGTAGGRGLAIGGIVTGLLGLIIAGVLIALGAAFLNSDSVQNLQDCVENAGNDQAEVDRCSEEFGNNLEDSTN